MSHLTARKRIFSVMIEAFQNATKHGLGQPTVQVQNEDSECIVSTRNIIRNSERENIIKRVSEINTLSENQLRSRYLDVLQRPATAQSCGLGFIFMRRKSGNPLEFNFTEIDTLHSYFFLRVRVPLVEIVR